MELTGERLIPADQATTWAALNDPEALKACIEGCESLERVDDDTFEALVAVRVGPVSARFKGRLKLKDIQPPDRYTLQFEGQGGAAGFGKGTAEVALAAHGHAATLLRYTARAQVGGKMAQIGSRLVDAAAARIADDFFAAFERRLAPAQPAEVAGDGAPAPAAIPRARPAWALRVVVAIAALIVIYLVMTSTR